jgi:calcineurin-like phosphoesterase family protein
MLGDFAFGNHEAVNNYIKKLNGSIIFVKGNHDRGLETWCKINGQKLHESYTFKIYGEEIFMAHFAHRVWHKSHYGTIHAYGHSHDMLPPLGLSMDAGVDGNNFKPHNIKDFIKRMEPIREQMIKEGLIFVNKHRK